MTRDEAGALLPFLANDTLEGEERQAVEAAVAEDNSLATELAALREIRKTLQAQDTGTTPGEFGLARLMRDVDREDRHAAVTAPFVARPRIWQIAAAVLLAVVIGQAALMSGMGGDGEGYELAGGGDASFTVAFAPGATEAAIRETLLEAGVEIVAGPSALGLYQLNLLQGFATGDAEATLREAGGIIESLDRAE